VIDHSAGLSRLRFKLGGFEAEGFEIRLSRGRLLYFKEVGLLPCGSAQVVVPTKEQWHRFWQEVDRIGVWAWLPEYVNDDILDGTQWSLSLGYDGRNLKS
jgi:hypothetical protein